MKLIQLIFLISSTVLYCNAWLGDQSMEAGDLIRCKPNNLVVGLFQYHALMALSSNKLIHVIGHNDKASIIEETVEQYLSRDMEKNCHNTGPGSEGREKSVASARQSLEKFKGKKVYYNRLTCNCQHWVEYWANGQAKSPSSKRCVSTKCDVPRRESCSLLKEIFNL